MTLNCSKLVSLPSTLLCLYFDIYDDRVLI